MPHSFLRSSLPPLPFAPRPAPAPHAATAPDAVLGAALQALVPLLRRTLAGSAEPYVLDAAVSDVGRAARGCGTPVERAVVLLKETVEAVSAVTADAPSDRRRRLREHAVTRLIVAYYDAPVPVAPPASPAHESAEG